MRRVANIALPVARRAASRCRWVALLVPLVLGAAGCGRAGESLGGELWVKGTGAAITAADGEYPNLAPGAYRVTTLYRIRSTPPRDIELPTVDVPDAPKQPRVWVTSDGPLRICPVFGAGYFADDFGAPRYTGGYHPHAGNDIFAPAGTPIVATFDGVAVRTPNTIGGLAVKVYGAAGYTYNAHLFAYGKQGPVRMGDVIGYVGDTGNAQGGAPHNHFEWHPGNGPAVNPFPYLLDACTSG